MKGDGEVQNRGGCILIHSSTVLNVLYRLNGCNLEVEIMVHPVVSCVSDQVKCSFT